MIEIWKAISNWLGYEISNLGRVRSFKKHTKFRAWDIVEEPQRILSPSLSNGYLGVNLSHNGSVSYKRVASLVLEAFVAPRPDGMEVCHNNCDKTNNRLDNLRYDTPSGNSRDGVGKRTATRLTNEQAVEVRLLAAKGVPDHELAKRFDVSTASISGCRLGYSYVYADGPITKRPDTGRPPEIVDKNIGLKLRAARVRSGKKQGEVAKEVGISQTWLSRVELGKENPSKDLVYRLKEATGWTAAIAQLVTNGYHPIPSQSDAPPASPHHPRPSGGDAQIDRRENPMNRKTRIVLEIEEKYNKDISQVLTELYQELGTQTAVAEELGVDMSAINRWRWRLGLSFEQQPVVRRLAGGDSESA